MLAITTEYVFVRRGEAGEKPALSRNCIPG
jgi:hypothetical protein